MRIRTLTFKKKLARAESKIKQQASLNSWYANNLNYQLDNVDRILKSMRDEIAILRKLNGN